jgi:hypothetical protein
MGFRQQYPSDTVVVIYSDNGFTSEYLRPEMPLEEPHLIYIWNKGFFDIFLVNFKLKPHAFEETIPKDRRNVLQTSGKKRPS